MTIKTLDHQKLDVTKKTPSNIFGWRGQCVWSSFDKARKLLQNDEHEN